MSNEYGMISEKDLLGISPPIIGVDGLRRNLDKSIIYTQDRVYYAAHPTTGKLAYDDKRGFYVAGEDNKCRKIVREGDEIELPINHQFCSTMMRRYKVSFKELSERTEGLWLLGND